MDRIQATLPGFVALFALLLVLLPSTTTAAGVAYCSSQNTGSDSQTLFHTWQSNGWCTDECTKKGTFAYAVILEKDCWCSNYTPEDQEDTSECNDDCPGYPDEKCGNKASNLYIYLKLDGKPSGTKGTSKPTSANVSPSPSAPPPASSSFEPSKAPPPASETITSETPSPTTLKTSAASAPAPSSDAPSSESPPVTSVQIVTVSGVVVTQTVVSSPTSAPVVEQPKKSGTNVGAIVGGVLGGLVVLAAIIGAVFFVLWRRRRQQQDDDQTQNGVQRNTSTMSKAGLLRTEKSSPYPPPIATNFTRRSSRMLDNDSISPISGSDRRSSRPYIFDQRLNPSAIMNFENASRGSFASMDDSRDYGRTLNVRNPDPDHH